MNTRKKSPIQIDCFMSASSVLLMKTLLASEFVVLTFPRQLEKPPIRRSVKVLQVITTHPQADDVPAFMDYKHFAHNPMHFSL